MQDERKPPWYICRYSGENVSTWEGRDEAADIRTRDGEGCVKYPFFAPHVSRGLLFTLLISEVAKGLHVGFFFLPPLHRTAFHSTPKAQSIWITLVLSIQEFSVVPDHKIRAPNAGHSSPNRYNYCCRFAASQLTPLPCSAVFCPSRPQVTQAL